jgi:hypothetical protein
VLACDLFTVETVFLKTSTSRSSSSSPRGESISPAPPATPTRPGSPSRLATRDHRMPAGQAHPTSGRDANLSDPFDEVFRTEGLTAVKTVRRERTRSPSDGSGPFDESVSTTSSPSVVATCSAPSARTPSITTGPDLIGVSTFSRPIPDRLPRRYPIGTSDSTTVSGRNRGTRLTWAIPVHDANPCRRTTLDERQTEQSVTIPS